MDSNQLKTKDTLDGANLQLASIGNCAFSALLDKKGQVVWACFPRFDGDPIFCNLVRKTNAGQSAPKGTSSNEIGFFDVCLSNFSHSEQSYIRNSAVVSTKLYDKHNQALEIIDFVPRFQSWDREFRPNMMIRIVKPIKGRPRAQIRLRPTFGYGWGTPEKTRGSNHIRYLLSTMTIRLTTNAPISYIADEVNFEITEPLYLVLMPDESMKSSLEETSNTFLKKTLDYWKGWVKSLTIPFEWQEPVIRACITLRLNSFEETGAVIAAMTTSIPQGPNGGRWDYRYCWLRDSYWVVRVLNELGATDILENYLRFISNIVSDFTEHAGQKRIQPVYGISLETRLHEREMHRLAGYRGMGPVCLGNRDAESIQHDVFGSLILALTQTFFDRRLETQGTEVLFEDLQIMGNTAIEVFDKPDAGPRGGKTAHAIHTFSSVMCWAACDRLARIAEKIKSGKADHWKKSADTIKSKIMENAWNSSMNSFVNTWGGDEVDAYLLLLPQIGFIEAKNEKFLSTLQVLEKSLKRGKHIVCFPSETIAHNPATFWYIDVLASVGRIEEARSLFEYMLNVLNHVGILSETMDSSTNELWGNFPQSTAMVGLINCAVRLSKPWKGAF